MKIQKDKIIHFLLYSGFGLLCFIAFFILTLPSDLIERRLLLQLKKQTGCEITVGLSHYQFPNALRWQQISGRCPKRRLGLQGRGDLSLELTSLELTIAPLPLLFNQEGEIDFTLRHNTGQIPGDLRITQTEEGLFFELHIEDAQLTLAQEGIGGTIQVSGEGRWSQHAPQKGSGTIALKIKDARFEKWNDFSLPIGEIKFKDIEAQLSLKDQRLTIESLAAQGPTVDLEGEGGTILIRQPAINSLLNLSLQARPKDSLEDMAALFIKGHRPGDPIKIRLAGSARSPKVSINGKNMRLGF